jgi:hypothetical protein
MGLTTDPTDPRLTRGVDAEPTRMAEVYLVLSEEELAEGFVRPVKTSYKHLVCGTVTTMAPAIAKTYARNPSFYGATWCCGCLKHLPVGEDGEFIWTERRGNEGLKVGT